MSRCRSCQAEITWALLKGKPHPLDAKATTGRYRLVHCLPEHRCPECVAGHPCNGTPRAVWTTAAEGPTPQWHTSHFATCPNAKDWRKKT